MFPKEMIATLSVPHVAHCDLLNDPVIVTSSAMQVLGFTCAQMQALASRARWSKVAPSCSK